MEDRAAIQKELKEVKQGLGVIERQLEELINYKDELLKRKAELEEKLLTNPNDQSSLSENWNKDDFKWSERVSDVLKNIFRLNEFRPLQLQTINVTMSGKDCILIMPTGGGKSLCYQLPAIISSGITLVISPLVSLMEDQLMSLDNLGVNAALLNASSSKDEVKRVHDAMINKSSDLKLLYVTPEKLKQSKRFMSKLEKMYEMGRLSRLAIDEVHCCSQWGHDFRPDYKFLGILKRQFPGTPIIGLTATATSKVLEDVKSILNIPKCLIFQDSFNRPNLYYEIRQKSASHKDNMAELQKLIKTTFPNQSGIVYCLSQKDCEEVTKDLMSSGIKAGCYHARLDASQRSQAHKKWVNGEIQVVVATIAFGMGIDKPDVRFVIHHSLSKSMENYYQESGRAGRDFSNAYCVLYFRLMDVFRQSTMVFTEQGGLEKLYSIMTYCLDTGKCRRTMIARHFGERWDSSLCNKMCDHCSNNNPESSISKDVTRHCQEVLNILEKASLADTKLTAAKLVDAWLGKGPGHLKAVEKTNLIREECEIVIGHMLLEGFLREDFHFTPYTTISYIVTGSQAKLLKGGKQVIIEFSMKSTTSISNKRLTTERPSSTNTKVVMNQLKPKFSVDPERSKSVPSNSVNSMMEDEMDSVPEVRKSARLSKSLKIAISHIETSDNDVEIMDIGENSEKNSRQCWAEPVALKRPNSGSSNNRSGSSDFSLSPVKVGPRKKQKVFQTKTDSMEVEDSRNSLKNSQKLAPSYIVLDSDSGDDFVEESRNTKNEPETSSLRPRLEAKTLVTNILRKRGQKIELLSESEPSDGDPDENEGAETEGAETGFKLRSWFSDENIDKRDAKTLKDALLEEGNLECISEVEMLVEGVSSDDEAGGATNIRRDAEKVDEYARRKNSKNIREDDGLKTESIIDIKSMDVVSYRPKTSHNSVKNLLLKDVSDEDFGKDVDNFLIERNDVESDVDLSHMSSDVGDDVSQICRVYAKQLSTIDAQNGDSEDDESSNYRQGGKIQSAESMETIDEVEDDLGGVTGASEEDECSVEQSIENLDRNLPPRRRIPSGYDTENVDSEAELEQLKHVYRQQLNEITD